MTNNPSSEALQPGSEEAELKMLWSTIHDIVSNQYVQDEDSLNELIVEPLIDLIHQREKQTRNQAQIEALLKVREKLKYLLTDYELEIIDQQIEEIEK